MQQVTGHWDSGFVMVMKQVRQPLIHRDGLSFKPFKSVSHFSSVIIAMYISPGLKDVFNISLSDSLDLLRIITITTAPAKILLSSPMISNDNIYRG